MNKRQKLVQQQFINDEETVIKRLKQVYGQSLKDITGKISELDSSIAVLQKALDEIGDDDIGDLARAVLGSKAQFTPEEARETVQSMLQSKVYQKKYQAALKKQVDGIYDTMLDKEFKTVSDYIEQCYENGFVGTMFDLNGQGIPLCFPIDQEAMVRAVQLDSKISQGLYSRLGEDVALLKKKITAQVSRGVATGMSYQQVAQQLASYSNIGFNNAVRIARTEGHRVQVQSGMDACYKAKEKGADVVKQWDAALDARTRESHALVDGEIRELDKPFSNGLMFPGDPDGAAAEVVNCRCALLQRAKWALDDDELQTLKERAEYYGLDKAEEFDDFKKKYLKAVDGLESNESGVDMGKKPNIADDSDKLLTNAGSDDIIPSESIDDVYDLSKYTHVSDSELNEWKKQCGVSTREEYSQIYKHTKADGSNGGYVRSHRGWAFNAELREGKEDLFDEDDKKTLSTIRKLCKQNATDRPVLLDRFVDSDYLSEYSGFFNRYREDLLDDAVDFVQNFMIGTDKIERSIVSASYGANVLTDRDIHIRLHCPKGTHMFVTNNKRESEVLFHDGLTYEIVGAGKESYEGLFGVKHRLVLDVVVKNYGL